jgi:GNAT superfamily N-acetyltransferase
MAADFDANAISLIEVNPENIAKEHICCAIGSDKVNRNRALEKKEWLSSRFERGHRFLKADVRGKLFIEYSPTEISVFPVHAVGWAMIQCFWVSGRYKGHGIGRKLFDQFESDCRAAGYRGAAAVVASSKKPFMVDKSILTHFGFEVVDRADPYYELIALRFDAKAEPPRFFESARRGGIDNVSGLDFFYSPCCPFNKDFAGIMSDIAGELGFEVRMHLIDAREDLNQLPTPWGLFSVFLDGELLSAEVMTGPKFRALLESKKQ